MPTPHHPPLCHAHPPAMHALPAMHVPPPHAPCHAYPLPPVNRMTDRRLWKYYLAATSLRAVMNLQSFNLKFQGGETQYKGILPCACLCALNKCQSKLKNIHISNCYIFRTWLSKLSEFLQFTQTTNETLTVKLVNSLNHAYSKFINILPTLLMSTK